MTTPKNPEVRYRRELEALVRSLRVSAEVNLIPALRELESEYVSDSYALTLEQVFERMRKAYVNLNVQAQRAASSFVEGANEEHKRRFYSSIEDAVGVDLSSIVQNENLEDTLLATTRQNVSLIKSIPEEYFKKIESIVFTNTAQGTTAGNTISQIRELNGSSLKRAKLIARDQSSKLNSALNKQRQQNLGIEEYIWRSAGDERVRHSHRSKNGKIFRWDSPPSDTGHPGQDIQCRCVAQPIVKFEN